ncbi:iron ABC transporter permease [Brevibacillus fulvus]|uniref:Iron complex transport system permease protein n=2 Tax=Brevibacillus fulvus TaxID=1125967 RepID=A0A939BUD5_9BACL|nr:iron ABC transporter permease [Brevibacillus fulvus]MBM7590359.1 iron complex transport system permease protein [Brevibacillus fulvus]
MEILSARRRKAFAVGGLMLAVAICTMVLSLNTGTIWLSPITIVQTLFGFGDADAAMVLFDYRLPRILVCALAGIGLAVSGSILQGISRNSLADPGILGLHAGASCGLIVFITFFRSLEDPLALFIPLFTFAGGTIAALLIFLLAYNRQTGLQPVRMILVGIAVTAGFSAISLFFSLRLDEDTYSFTSRWLVGSVWGRDWENVYALFPWVTIFTCYSLWRARILDAFSLGDERAIGIGVALQRERLWLLLSAVALSSASVAMVGGVGFIGLVAPHLAKRLVGSTAKYQIPVAALIGLIILAAADMIGRTLFLPNSIPAGVIVAAVGAPYFLFLLVKAKS